MIVYGIKNCDTVKKSLDWLKANQVDYEFHDYKTEGISKAKLKSWVKQVGMDTIFNKKSSTWRDLSDAEKANITTDEAAIALMAEKNSIIKRPVIEKDNKVVAVGYDEAAYKAKL